MDERVRAVLLASFRHVLRPLVRFALRNGISYEDFAGSVKRVFVESAREDFSPAGEPMSESRTTILTGLRTIDVRRTLEEIEKGLGDELERAKLVGRLIEGWHQDADFTGPYGIPIELSLKAGPSSFPALVERYGGKYEPKAVLSELMKAGLVQESKNNRIRLASRSYITGKFKPDALDRMGRTLGDLAETLEHNLDPSSHGPPLFERAVYTPKGIDNKTYRDFTKFLSEAGQEFLEKLDNWLTEKEQEVEQQISEKLIDAETVERNKSVKVGVGIYLYEHKMGQWPKETGELSDAKNQSITEIR